MPHFSIIFGHHAFQSESSYRPHVLWLSPNSITPTFTEISHGESCGHKSWKLWTQTVTNHKTMKFRWKSLTQITKVAHTNHLDMSRCLRQSLWQVQNKPVCVALMEFSLLHSTWKVGDKVHRLCCTHKSQKSATQIMKVDIVMRVANFHDLCPRQSRELCCWLCRKVGVMEFSLYPTNSIKSLNTDQNCNKTYIDQMPT